MCLGIPGRIIEIRQDAGLPMGVVDFGGVRRDVCLAYVADEVSVGDYAVVHVGFAISKVDEEEAHRTYDVLKEMGELNELQWVREAAEAAAAVEAPANAADAGNGAGDSGLGGDVSGIDSGDSGIGTGDSGTGSRESGSATA